MTPGREFVFSYMTNKSTVMFDGTMVNLKMGPFRKKSFPFHSIVNWYVYEEKAYRSIFFTYINESGKQKKIQLFAQLGEIGFRDLIEELNASIGAKGLNHLPQKEALKVMKAANPKKVGAIGAMVIILILTTTFAFPGLRHYFDFGFEEMSVEQLINGEDAGTRNLKLLGFPLDQTLEETTKTTRNGSTTTTIQVYIPIVPSDWEDGDPVHVIMQFDELSDEDYYGALGNSDFVGVVRNIWFEGLEDDQIQFFKDEYGMDVSDDVILFEVTGEEHNDSAMFYGWLAINGIFLILFSIMYIRNR